MVDNNIQNQKNPHQHWFSKTFPVDFPADLFVPETPTKLHQSRLRLYKQHWLQHNGSNVFCHPQRYQINVEGQTLTMRISGLYRDRNSSDFFVLHEFWLNLYPFLITNILDWHFSMPFLALKHEVLKWSKKSFTLHRDRLHWITQLQRGTWHAFDIVVLTTHRSIQIFKALTGRTWGLTPTKWSLAWWCFSLNTLNTTKW